MTETNQWDHGGQAVQTDGARAEARKRLEKRRNLASGVLAYVVINAALVGVWAVTGGGYFWPGWVVAGWGAVLILHARETFWRRPISDADIDAEIRRRSGH